MFTQEQLELIRVAAKHVKNQGELAVFRELGYVEDAKNCAEDKSFSLFTEQQWNIIQYCAEECKRQRSGEMSVYDMVNAWNFMQVEVRDYMVDAGYPQTQLTKEIISHVGTLVEPHDNAKGFRTIPIGVWDGFTWHEKAQWAEVPRLLEHLLASYYGGFLYPAPTDECLFDPSHQHHSHDDDTFNILSQSAEDEFYYNYENIHPFVDGNGRSGKILYNYLLGTLDNPVLPPNFWGGNNP